MRSVLRFAQLSWYCNIPAQNTANIHQKKELNHLVVYHHQPFTKRNSKQGGGAARGGRVEGPNARHEKKQL